MKQVLEFPGFESLYDFERDLYEAIGMNKEIPPEYTGTIRVTIEYIPSEDEV